MAGGQSRALKMRKMSVMTVMSQK